MARGKQTCKILKEIRRQIAEANDIEFVTSECRFKGDCLGTCPKCEEEVRYLERQLRARYLLGKAIALTGISTGMLLISGCSPTSTQQTNETSSIEPINSIEQSGVTDIVGAIGEVENVKKRTISNDSNKKVLDREAAPIIHDSDIAVVGGVPPIIHDRNHVYESAEVMPEFPGGDRELLTFLREHVIYPEEELKNGKEGRVVVRFKVDTLGRVSKPKILRSKGPAFDREALRVVSLLPDFTPGKVNGQIVNSWYTVPVTFKLPAD